ncbi:MAG: P-loop NTPase [Desulfovibrionaceae bacterium]|nr:P-loop NTPase [Desulfovibrionaceae bacterium]
MIQKTKYIAVASGKGGVGKSTLTLNLCNALSKRYSMLSVDCDLGLANLDVLLGKTATYTLQDILCGLIQPQEACIEITPRFSLLPSASGTLESIGMDTMAVHLLFKKCVDFFNGFDCIFFDLGASITPITLSFIQHATHTVVVITPEPASLVDSYALIKVLATRSLVKDVYIVYSMVTEEQHAQELFNILQTNIEQTLGDAIQIHYLGYVQYSLDVLHAVYNQHLLLDVVPHSVCVQNIESISQHIERDILH